MNLPVVVSIGCTDPWNAAGVGLDIRALAACGVRPLTVVAGVTAQDVRGLHAARAIDAALVTAQCAAIDGARASAIRIGALLDVASVRAVAAYVGGTDAPAVYDPVLGPSGGGRFLDDATIEAIVTELLPRVALVTPNLEEAARLGGGPVPRSLREMAFAAGALCATGARAVLVTGGHRETDATDVLVDADGTELFEGARLAEPLRGTGCLLACGIAAALAYGAPLRDAIARGRGFVRERFERAVEAGGMRMAY